MKIRFNDKWVEIAEQNLADFLTAEGLEQKQGIAVAINDEVIPRSEWNQTQIEENDQLLIITAAAGG
ncbi:MAG: sulfur carrier protein ThiS [Crocinitomicaceae bacterium]|jgi:sulfur carrier protein|nr:sulfur carrier protein ThiS [Crocinitomicaceae bacterium]